MSRWSWTRPTLTAVPEEETVNPMPDNLSALEPFLPLGPLARLLTEGAPRWAYAVLAADMAGPWRRLPRLGAELLDHGLPAVPQRPQRIPDGYRQLTSKEGTVRELVYRDGPMLPAEPAVPPLRRLVDAAGTEETLAAVLIVLDGLAAQEPEQQPDCPDGWAVPGWPAMRTVMGETPPPLRWSPPAGRSRRPELAALYPNAPHPRLVGVPRCAPPYRRPGGLVASDGRLLAVQALLAHAAVHHGVQPEPESLRRALAWIVGPERAVAPVTERGTFAREWAVPGVAEADQELAVMDPGALAEQLLNRLSAPATS